MSYWYEYRDVPHHVTTEYGRYEVVRHHPEIGHRGDSGAYSWTPVLAGPQPV